MVALVQNFRTGDEPRTRDFVIANFIDGDEFHMPQAFWEGARDAFVIDNSIPEHGPIQKRGVKIRFFEARGEALSQLG